MTFTYGRSPDAQEALTLITSLQSRFAQQLTLVAQRHGDPAPFSYAAWGRDEGTHGGGARHYAALTKLFNRAAINMSQVHYDDLPDKRLASATALSTIIHPQHPRAPSVHMHFSFTEMRNGRGTWRLMADLNPSIPHAGDLARYEAALAEVDPQHFKEAKAQGEKYFFIPSLGRHRGAFHYYLEGWTSGNFAEDRAHTKAVAERAIDEYVGILDAALREATSPPTDDQRRAQLEYHSLYFLQVLTLDRGTTSGLMVHDQNDVGIMGSLPSFVDRNTLQEWVKLQTAPQDALLQSLVDALVHQVPTPVDDTTRQTLAGVVREHYRAHPEALDLQAKGNIVPPTVQNHR